MNNTYLVVGVRKGLRDNIVNNINVQMYANEQAFRKTFAWIDGPDGNNMRKGTIKLTLDHIIKALDELSTFRCENDDFFYIFKKNLKPNNF